MKHMKLMGKKVIMILHLKIGLYWTYGNCLQYSCIARIIYKFIENMGDGYKLIVYSTPALLEKSTNVLKTWVMVIN